ncbi:hypothetical protein [Desulfopila aestuarii]|uniref:Uncharacterized protein n=1 Tax=Desulfopila aestuarii DSM 18488 TaxID=1121416 RepID=A0A1M7YJP8_9BACT|nr:hypothetical protein [Desulfopila aestuarii]SHO52835.1 hypothetical protein SAMN02745220_04793 [Desulfopila aestuarii DSM 18488]
MAYASLGITLVSPESLATDSGDWLKLVQQPWPEPPDGGFSEWLALNGYGYSLATLQLYWAKYKSHCYSDGVLDVELEIHKSRPDLAYTLTASYGELSDIRVDTVEHITSITVKGESSIDLESLVVGAMKASWEGSVYDLSGAQIPYPPISLAGSVLSWGGIGVVGVLRVAYTEEHEAATLTITPREPGEYLDDEIEAAYQSTAIAIWGNGNIEALEIELPSMTGNCRGGSSARINPDDPDEPEDGDCYDLYIRRHRCTGEILSEQKVKVPCPDEADGS